MKSGCLHFRVLEDLLEFGSLHTSVLKVLFYQPKQKYESDGLSAATERLPVLPTCDRLSDDLKFDHVGDVNMICRFKFSDYPANLL